MTDSAGSSEEAAVASGRTRDELIFDALSESYYDEPEGNGLDIDGIFNYIKERHEISESFMEELEVELENLVYEDQLEMVGNCYRIRPGLLDITELEGTSKPTQDRPSTSSFVPKASEAEHSDFEAKDSEGASNPTQSMSSEDSTKSQDRPSTSSFVPTASEEKPEIDVDATAKAIAEAEHYDFEAEKAYQVYDTYLQLLHESDINLSLAKEIFCQCAYGEKVFLK